MDRHYKENHITKTGVPQVTVSLEHSGAYYLLKANDNGNAIDFARHKDKLFDMQKTFRSNKDGKDLVLFITRRQL